MHGYENRGGIFCQNCKLHPSSRGEPMASHAPIVCKSATMLQSGDSAVRLTPQRGKTAPEESGFESNIVGTIGAGRWHWKVRIGGNETWVSYGTYPVTSWPKPESVTPRRSNSRSKQSTPTRRSEKQRCSKSPIPQTHFNALRICARRAKQTGTHGDAFPQRITVYTQRLSEPLYSILRRQDHRQSPSRVGDALASRPVKAAHAGVPARHGTATNSQSV